MKKFFKENIVYIIIILLAIFLSQVKLPYYIDTPGGTIDISDRIELDGEADVNGSLNLLYVSEYVATVPTYLLSFVIKDWDLVDIDKSRLYDEDVNEIYERNRVMLDNSIDNAMYVAYTKAEKKIEIKEYENVVVGVSVSNGLKIGDKILKANGTVINNANELKEIISASKVGDKLKVKILRENKEKEVQVEIYEEAGNKYIGVVVITNYDFEVEPEIEIKFKESESGSSGGLMLALSIYNALSTEDIIKGRNIAGTGTISIDGSVGEIDCIKYKIMGAYKDGMDLVLVPKGNYKEAMQVKEEKGYDIEIVEIATFDDAVDYLKNN